jgi:hypothetical protein
MKTILANKTGLAQTLTKGFAITACAILSVPSIYAATIVTWDATAPNFSSPLVVAGNSGTANLEARDLNNNRAPAQGIEVSSPFVLDSIYVEVSTVFLFDTTFQLVLAPATFNSLDFTLAASPANNVILDATITTPSSNPGTNFWVRFDIDNVSIASTIASNPYALFLTATSVTNVMQINRSSNADTGTGASRYFEQRNSSAKLLADANGNADMRFALVAVPEPASAALLMGALASIVVMRRTRRQKCA